MATPGRGHRYTGILNRSMPAPEPINALAINSPMNRDKMERELRLRLDALMRDCNVDPESPDRMIDLAFALASRHVPGFATEEHNAADARRAKQRRQLAIWRRMNKLIAKGMSQRELRGRSKMR